MRLGHEVAAVYILDLKGVMRKEAPSGWWGVTWGANPNYDPLAESILVR